MDTVKARRAHINALRAKIDHRLNQVVPDRGPSHRLDAAMRYALLAPGKRLRPLLVMLTAWRLGDEEAALVPACALEMVHAASLILDDLPCMDDAALRRGQPATHIRFGEDVAMLAAVGLLNQAYSLVARAPALSDAVRLEMVRILSDAVGLDGLVAGQDGDLRGEGETSPARVSDIHHLKTSVLFIAAAALGGLAGGAEPAELDALARFASELGLAFQTLDDIVDASLPVSEDDGRATLISLLGKDGARAEARRRLSAARAGLAAAGPRLAPLSAYLDILLETREPPAEMDRLLG
ncbi:MAG: polyprenyl synthetase family protein [Caulobacteraceae bacterium]